MRTIMHKIKNWVRSRGFTLVELLVVLGIFAVVGTAIVLVLNPAELLKQSRDANRVSSLATLRKAIGLFQANNSAPSALGIPNTIYVSLPDSDPACSNLHLGPAAFPYRCANNGDLLKTDGTGWLPIDFAAVPSASISSLPRDPLNQHDPEDTHNDFFYMYATDGLGHYEINAKTESAKYNGGN